jgi:NADPH-dependent 2,4-dienoyl-CoA reductase/sulfur reductase-like enzyme/rhodanese-related sulfurtransferase
VIFLSLKVLIIGAVAAGPKAGCRIKRLDPSAQVIMVDRDSLISYGGCGIPYYVSGDVSDLKGLLSTSFHMVRDPAFFAGAKGMEVRDRTEALKIDPAAKKVLLKSLADDREYWEDYDKLILATGSRVNLPPIPGRDLAGVWPVSDLHQAQAIKDLVSTGQVGSAVVVGAGATGLEMAESLCDLWGIETHLFEIADQVLPGVLDREMAAMLASHLNKVEDLYLHLGQSLEAILDDGQGSVRAVKAGGQEIEADLVILAAGVRPNAGLAAEAGLALAENGAIAVDDHMQTSDADILAAGDCVSGACLLTGKPRYMPAGSLANRQGRVAGTNACGGDAVFPPVAGSFCIKLFGLSAAHTGLGERAAAQAGLDLVAPLVVQADRAHFHPDMKLMYVKLMVEKGSRRLLGMTALGENGDAVVGRINAMAGLLALKGKLEDLSNLELAYSPPLGAAVDIVNAAANTAENMLAEKLRPMSPGEFSHRLENLETGDTVFLDMRAIDNAAPYLEHLAPAWQHLPQETLTRNLDKVPRDKDVVLICNSGVRSYEAQVMLDAAGIKNTFNLSGGVAAVKQWGQPILPPKEQDDDQ